MMNQSEEKRIKELEEALGEAWEINAELMAGLEVGAGRSAAKQKELRDLLDSCGREGKKVLAENYKLRELNAELVKLLKRAAGVIERNLDRRLGIMDEIESAVAKAETLK